MSLFPDDYGVRPWVPIGVVLAFLCALAGGLVASGAFDSVPATAQVQSKQEGWENGELIYWLLLNNGIQQRVTYSAWNSAQPGYSYASYSSTPGEDPESEEAEDPDISDTDTQYSIPETSVNYAAADDEVDDDDG